MDHCNICGEERKLYTDKYGNQICAFCWERFRRGEEPRKEDKRG